MTDRIKFSTLSGSAVPWFDPGVHTYDAHVGFHTSEEGCARTSGVGGLVILVVSLKKNTVNGCYKLSVGLASSSIAKQIMYASIYACMLRWHENL